MTASALAVNLSYIAVAFVPPVLWLIFYLREDRHPEPKHLLILTFIGGIVSVVFAVTAECAFVYLLSYGGSCREGFDYSVMHPFNLFLGIAFIEEYTKYLVVRFFILNRKDFDEPVDAMIYLITAALGFAAIENVLFLTPLLRENVFFGLEITANRFLGANLLHALSSGIVGFFLARAWFSPHRRHFIAIGIIIATLFHAGFNYLILLSGNLAERAFYIFLLLAVMSVMVFIDFEWLKKQPNEQAG